MSDCSEAVLLAGGAGKRLKPFSTFTSKHLLPIDNVPMIFGKKLTTNRHKNF